jgi:serine/threonine protein kinase
MSAKPSHLVPESIGDFLAGRLPNEVEVTVIRHLGTCPECQAELETAAGEPSWWNEARDYLSSAETRLSPEGVIEEIDGEQAEALTLDFLAPTDDPAMLGRVGPYEVAGVIGRGGTGVVLKAFERSLNRFVAIKVLAPHLATSGAARKRFAREAQAAAAVVHEHIVPIYAVDEHQGLPYLVMRYVPGRSLQERLARRGTLELAEVLRIGMQTAQGLAAAHAQGLVHRDVKPANILLEHNVDRVLLTDFGLARTVDDASLTCSGVIAGTPQYMAPEQARGEAIDHRTDLFSLGSALYAMCAGHSPFRAETTMGVLHRICKETPRPLRDLNPHVPDWLDRIIRRLHAKDPARRFQSAEEVAAVLARRLAMVQTPGMSWRDPWWQRVALPVADWFRAAPLRRTAIVTATALGLSLVLGDLAGYSLWSQPQLESSRGAQAQTATRNSDVPPRDDLPAWDEISTQAEQLQQAVTQLEQLWTSPSVPTTNAWNQEAAALWSAMENLEQELADPMEFAPPARPMETEQPFDQENRP